MNNKALTTLFFYNGIFVYSVGLLGPLYAVFVETIDQSVLSVSVTWFFYLLSSTLGLVVLRRYGDLIKEKEYLLLAGYLVRAIVWFLFPLTTTVLTLTFLQILLGVGEAMGSPAYDAIFAKHLDDQHYVKDYANWRLISNLVGAVAVLSGGVIVKYLGFNVLFYLMGTLAVVSFIGVLVQPRKLL